MYVKYNREYVTMYIEVLPEGQVVPLSILWKDGRKFTVEQIINIKLMTANGLLRHGHLYNCKRADKTCQPVRI